MLESTFEARAPRGSEMSCKGQHQEAARVGHIDNIIRRICGNTESQADGSHITSFDK